ncbi:kinase-like protein [Zopfia rhizophila CBS 207.26]|uniref:Kinase-like protein n=1 Tax=Zopfia rhizophila CBS 207.26 TaxID=1314779 RepID=A0A6A6EFR3_9PEZI|nr:kinase-like protein [Zopfia rhizophila CBS 207.26]
MENANLIACLYPHKKSRGARDAISKPENISRFVPRLLQELEPLLGRESRESTAPLEENKNEPPAYFYEDGLQLTFSHGPKGDKGFALGINQNQCDIVLPKLGEIKKLHGYFTFDDENRFIWRDSSTRGTIVTYDGKGGERRRKFTWILGGDKVPDKKTEEIVIELHEHLKFQIVVCKHEMHLDQYIDNIKRFRAETAVQDEPRIGILGMHSPGSTAPHSNAHTPNQGRIVLKQRTLGKGAFAVVTHSWDVSTGIEYACKKPRDRERFDTGSWEKEIDIMSKIRHDHIVQLCHWDKTPLPCLYLEYLPFGSIEYQHRKRHISYEESLTILHQSLSALEYLHGRKKPIVHRDIKPENILVLTRDPLHIKLSDFGLAKADGSLTTFCGTETYCPPEIAKYFGLSKSIPKDKYTEAVDIWSLGVVILKFALPNLPYPGSGVGIDWCEKIIDEVNNYDDDLIDFLSTTMLVMRPESRYSAQACLDRVEALFIPSRGGSLTPTPASYANEYEIMTAGYHVEERLAEEQLISSCDVSISKPPYSGYVAKQELSGLLL